MTSPRKLRGIAKEPIPYGAHVLCRDFQVELADPAIANGTAREPRHYRNPEGRYRKGDFVDVQPVEGLGQRDLHKLAQGPIMEPLRINLPAGKLTEEEYQERLDLQFRDAGIERA